eukprot:TRINITY_DN2411_c0_g1_i7.p1 TRINITY_DN2411_c0_g1~~TRINITY_DN2411_c0_g1_i7.p1  ORF type:complete len:307 (-),score=52.10 TRINITY_DN2411_c0_g1_i7:158-1027(-)
MATARRRQPLSKGTSLAILAVAVVVLTASRSHEDAFVVESLATPALPGQRAGHAQSSMLRGVSSLSSPVQTGHSSTSTCNILGCITLIGAACMSRVRTSASSTSSRKVTVRMHASAATCQPALQTTAAKELFAPPQASPCETMDLLGLTNASAAAPTNSAVFQLSSLEATTLGSSSAAARMPSAARSVGGARRRSRSARRASSNTCRQQHRRVGAKLQAFPASFESPAASHDVSRTRLKIQLGLRAASTHPCAARGRDSSSRACSDGASATAEICVAGYSFDIVHMNWL